MPTYSYTAVSAAGDKISGTETAASERELARVLREKGYILTNANTGEKRKRFSAIRDVLGGFLGVSLLDKLLFVRNLQVMVSAGVPLPKALDILSGQAHSKRFRVTLLDIKKKIVEGQAISQAMEAYPKIFPELLTNMIKVGEESGTLEDVLSRLTLQLEREHDLKSKIRGALLYPAIIVVAMMGIGTLMMIVVVPKLADTFEDLGVELPFTTKVIIGLSQFTTERWYIVLPLLVLFVVLFWRAAKTAFGKQVIDTLSLRVPILGGAIQKTNSALTTRTLSSLIFSGIPIVRALEITSRVVGNFHFQEALNACAEKVRTGAKVSEALRAYEGLYPSVVIQMIEVGEETGQTSEVLRKLADFFEEEISNITKNLTSIIEPILMLIIGVVVGFFAISMIQPMYSMLGAIK